jgi:hypothetical protein
VDRQQSSLQYRIIACDNFNFICEVEENCAGREEQLYASLLLAFCLGSNLSYALTKAQKKNIAESLKAFYLIPDPQSSIRRLADWLRENGMLTQFPE